MPAPFQTPSGPPLPLSVAIVCKNNDATIGRTLDSVRGLASEIVAVDSGSTDQTIPLLESHSARVVRSEWLGHIKTKQKALEACTQPWILCLDSDESCEPDLRAAIRASLSASPNACGFFINRKTYYRNRPLDHAWQPEWRLRLVRAGAARWGGHDPHDVLALTDPAAASSRLPGTLRHDSISTFADFLAKQAVHARTMAASLHAAGRRGSYLNLVFSPPGAFLKQLILKQAFLDGRPGILAAAATAAASLMKHAALLEISDLPPNPPPNPPETRA